MATGIETGARTAPPAWAAALAAALSHFARELKSRLAAWSEAETGQLMLWAPVALGAGAVFYFSLKVEPPLWLGILLLAASAAGFAASERLRAISGATFLLAFGFAVADLRALAVDAPILERELSTRSITGRLVSVEEAPKLRRLIIDVASIDGIEAQALPERARVSWRGAAFDVLPGDTVTLRARLAPPPSPEAPGAFDVGRQLYFLRIGAVGYALSAPERLDTGERGLHARWLVFIERARLAIARRITDVAPGASGAIVAAVVTGKREAIPREAERVLQDSGLAHLLAISGLHMGLATGLIFFAVRLGFAAIEPVALRYPIKKWAALAAMLALPPYLWLVGGSVPTQRATFMALVVLLAVLLDRRAISLRLVAWAAAAVLALTPEALLGPSFQMSFAAVTALVAAYEAWRRRGPGRAEDWPERLRLYLGGVLFSSLIAGLATAPFAAFHFERLPLWGLAGNLLAVPLTAIVIMPCCLLVYLFWLFGAAGPALWLLGWGVSALNWTAETVAALPAAAVLVPEMPLWGLAVLVLGGLWLCLWAGRWRWAGLSLILIGALSPLALRPPDLLVDGEMRVLAVADPAGALWLSTRRAGRFTAEVWLARRAQREAGDWDALAAEEADWFACDALGCRYQREGRAVALVFQGQALLEDCWGSDLLVALLPVGRACPRGTATLDRFDLWREGSWAIWVEAEGVRAVSVAALRGVRPWSPERTGDAVALPEGWEQ